MLDERAGTDLGEIADADIADNGRSGAEINAPADFWRAVRLRLFSADGDVLQDRHLVADHREGADDDAGGVIEKHRRSDRCGRMNADGKLIGRQALQQQREIVAELAPEPVGDAPRLQRDVSLEVQQRRQQRRRRGIVNGDALQIAARRIDQIGRASEGVTGEPCKSLAIRRTPAEPLADLVGQRVSEVRMVENGR